MSTSAQEHTGQSAERAGQFRLASRVVAALFAIVSLCLLWSSERVRVPHDLQLMSEAVAKPGEILAVRAIVLLDVDAPSGPELSRVPVKLKLVDAQGRTLGEEQLVPRLTGSMEGAVHVPETARETVVLEATAQLEDGPPLTCRRVIRVAQDAPLLAEVARPAGPLQQLSVGALRTVGQERAPSPFLPRVLGGACLPEERCTLLVWVGEPASAVAGRESPQVSVVGVTPAAETQGIVAIDVVAHGLDAQLTLEARREGRLVAERTLRLPLGLGEVGVFVDETLLAPEADPQVSLVLPPGREHAILDVFADGRWRASQSVEHVAARPPFPLPAAWFPPGALTRLQARSDRFSSDGAGARVFYRRAPGVSDELALKTLAALAGRAAHSPETRDFERALPPELLEDPQRTAAFLLAPLERTRVPLPEAVSSRPEQLARVDGRKRLLRFGVAGVLVLAALLVGVSLMRQGLTAADQASAILEQAREPGEAGARDDTRIGVILFVLAVALAFLAAALLIVAKPLWF